MLLPSSLSGHQRTRASLCLQNDDEQGRRNGRGRRQAPLETLVYGFFQYRLLMLPDRRDSFLGFIKPQRRYGRVWLSDRLLSILI